MDLRHTIHLLERLVAFDTVSDRPNRPLIDWVADRLDALRIRVEIIDGDEPGKANLFATVGPPDVPGVMLAGHSDVVPVAGQPWTSDPFTLTARDGRLVGRGAADMKGFIACLIEMAPRFASAPLRAPVHFALSYNEETDMRGMKQVARWFDGRPIRPAACVIGEPTLMRVVVANKGAAIYRVRVRGFEVHSSLRDRGVSAVENAAEIVVFLNRLQDRLRTEARHDGFEFPFSSVHVGRIQGGTAHNITARDCELLFEVRALPGVQAASIVDEVRDFCAARVAGMRRIHPEADIVVEELVDAPGLDERGNGGLARTMMPLCRCHAPGRVSFGTEAGILQGARIPTVVCGPGDIAVAHQADEWIEPGQLDACLGFLDALAERLSNEATLPADWTA